MVYRIETPDPASSGALLSLLKAHPELQLQITPLADQEPAEALLAQTAPIVRRDFLRRLYYGNTFFTEEQLHRWIRQKGISFDPGIRLQILNAAVISERNASEDTAILEFAFDNIILETILQDTGFPDYCLHQIDDLHMITLLIPEGRIPLQELRRRAAAAAESVRRALGQDTFMVATKNAYAPLDLPKGKRQADLVFPNAPLCAGTLLFAEDPLFPEDAQPTVDPSRILDLLRQKDRNGIIIYTRGILGQLREKASGIEQLQALHASYQSVFYRYIHDLGLPLQIVLDDPSLHFIEQAADRGPEGLLRYTEHLYDRIQACASQQTGTGLIDEVRAYIREHQREELTREKIAQHFAVSPNYLSRLFSTQDGLSLREYINRCRIDTAMKLMLSTGLSLGEIAAEAGYENAQYFSYIFRKETGMTPREWRSRRDSP